MWLESKLNKSPYLSGKEFRNGWIRNEKFICRLAIDQPDAQNGGTGVLVGPDVVLTCFHVLKNAIPHDEFGPTVNRDQIAVQFDYLENHSDIAGGVVGLNNISLADDWVIRYRKPSKSDSDDSDELPDELELDYALIRLMSAIGNERGWLSLSDVDINGPLALPSDFLCILQHPGLREQQAAIYTGELSFNENRTRIRHRANTEPGSSGSPCFDSNWKIVALHHAGAYNPEGKAKFNQGVPIARIVKDLHSEGIRFDDKTPAVMSTTSSTVGDFEPTLIVVCTDDDHHRAQYLLEEANIPPQFVARIGNQPPATVADNAIAVYLGSSKAAQDPGVLHTISELRDLNLQVLPVVTDLKEFNEQTPKELRLYNGAAWPVNDHLPQSLCSRIRQLLGLEVAAKDRSVFISYYREDCRAQIQQLRDALIDCSYDVFVDLNDLPAGEPVAQKIDKQLSGAASQALLFIETENAHKSKWIYDELKWAYTRSLAMVIWQFGEVSQRISLIGDLPVRYANETQLSEATPKIAKLLDVEIAQANTRNIQLARTLEGIVERYLKSRSVVIESLPNTPNEMLLHCHKEVAGRVIKGSILFLNSHRRPTPQLVQSLVDLYNQHKPSAAVLLFDAPEQSLSDDDQRIFDLQRGDAPIWLIPRQDAPEQLGEIIDNIV